MLGQRNNNHNSDNKIVLSFGGTDRGQFSCAVAKALRKKGVDNPILLVFTSGDNLDVNTLDYVTTEFDVSFEIAVDMPKIIADCSLLLCGAGQTSLEALVAKVPFVATIMAANQEANAKALIELGISVVSKFDPEELAFLTNIELKNECFRHSFINNRESGAAI